MRIRYRDASRVRALLFSPHRSLPSGLTRGRGMARRKAQNPIGTCLWRRHAGASRRATCGDLTTPGRAFRLGSQMDTQVVSLLQAGTRNGPGRSPGAARVFGCEPNPQAPHPVPPHERLMSAPLSGRGGCRIMRV